MCPIIKFFVTTVFLKSQLSLFAGACLEAVGVDEADSEEELEHGVLLRDKVPDDVDNFLGIDLDLIVQRIHVGRRFPFRLLLLLRQGGCRRRIDGRWVRRQGGDGSGRGGDSCCCLL